MSRRGFSLIEVIAVLVLMGILAAIAGLMLTSTVQRYGLEREAAANNQKLEVALARMVKELDWADWTTVQVQDAGRTLRWTSRHPDRVGDGQQTLTWNGTAGADLLLNSRALIDRVQSFAVADTVASGYVEAELTLQDVPQTFRVRAAQQEVP